MREPLLAMTALVLVIVVLAMFHKIAELQTEMSLYDSCHKRGLETVRSGFDKKTKVIRIQCK